MQEKNLISHQSIYKKKYINKSHPKLTISNYGIRYINELSQQQKPPDQIQKPNLTPINSQTNIDRPQLKKHNSESKPMIPLIRLNQLFTNMLVTNAKILNQHPIPTNLNNKTTDHANSLMLNSIIKKNPSADLLKQQKTVD